MTRSTSCSPGSGTSTATTLRFGVLDLLWVTVLISLLAMLIAVPIAIGIALFITQYAPTRLARPVAYVIDLLAAIPSIIYGIWGITVLAPKLAAGRNGRSTTSPGSRCSRTRTSSSGTIFNGGVVLAIMILPIVTAISRDVFERTPRQNVEAAWALGATRWEMIRLAVLPYGRPGVISGAMLGLGRALGETIAITLILSKVGRRIAVLLLDLQRRRDIRLQDRQQRRRVQQPARRPAPTSRPAWCCSCSPSPSTPPPAASSTGARSSHDRR